MAASNVLDSHVKDILTCSLCLEILSNPRTLQCLHSYCEECLAQMKMALIEDVDGYECPICRVFTAASEVRKVHLVYQLLDAYKAANCDESERQCTLCNKECSWICLDCKNDCYMCDICKNCHDKLNSNNDEVHEVQSVKQFIESNRILERPLHCNIHKNNKRELFCVDCEQLICLLCNVQDHDCHKSASVEDALKQKLPKVNKDLNVLADEIEKHKNNIVDKRQQLVKTIKRYKAKRKQACRKLDEEIKRLKEEHARNLSEIEVNSSDEQKKHEKFILDEEIALKEDETLVSWITTTLSKTSGARLLEELQSGLQDKLKTRLESKPHNHIQRTCSFPFATGNYRLSKTLKVCDGRKYQHLRISIVWGCFYLPNHVKHQLVTYSLDGLHKEVLELDIRIRSPRALVELNSKHAAVAADTGLFIIDKRAQIVQEVDNGDYCDILGFYTGPNRKMTGLEDTSGQVKIFTECDANQTVYKLERNIQLSGYINGRKPHNVNTFLMVEKHVFVAFNESKSIVKYDLQGQVLHLYETQATGFSQPLLCGLDSESNLLVCNSSPSKIQTLAPDGKINTILETKKYPWYAAFENRNSLFVVFSDNTLCKYEFKD